jgi:hypothetical protein
VAVLALNKALITMVVLVDLAAAVPAMEQVRLER